MIARGLLAALAAVAVLSGCRQEQIEAPQAAAGEAQPTTTAESVFPDPAEVKLALEEPIPVRITEKGIVIDETPIPGPTELQVTNEASVVHSLVVEGPGGRAELEAPLQPLETRTMVVNLQPGTYRVYCPQHPDETLSTEMRVEAQPPA